MKNDRLEKILKEIDTPIKKKPEKIYVRPKIEYEKVQDTPIQNLLPRATIFSDFNVLSAEDIEKSWYQNRVAIETKRTK